MRTRIAFVFFFPSFSSRLRMTSSPFIPAILFITKVSCSIFARQVGGSSFIPVNGELERFFLLLTSFMIFCFPPDFCSRYIQKRKTPLRLYHTFCYARISIFANHRSCVRLDLMRSFCGFASLLATASLVECPIFRARSPPLGSSFTCTYTGQIDVSAKRNFFESLHDCGARVAVGGCTATNRTHA